MNSPDQKPLRLRIASGADAEGIVCLVNAAFDVERFFLDQDRIDIQEVRERLESGTFLLAEQNGPPVGCVYVEPRGERAYLGLLAVDPSRQGSGLGKFLMTAAEEHCRNAGCRSMDLRIVNLRTDLPGFYRKLGYVETGTTAPFPAEARVKRPCHLVEMTKRL